MNFKLSIERMRDNFYNSRPDNIHLHRPWWMFVDDELSKIYKDKKVLLQQGKVYYACLMQANTKLFQKFPPFDYPAQIVYSTSFEVDENPLLLKDTIEEIYSYKYSDENPPEQWKDIVENIRNEKDRSILSFACSYDNARIDARMQTLMIFRKHLPTGILSGNVLPIIACPDACDSVIVLPSEYWSDEFKEFWFAHL
ncbi:MAG: hypothetical protein IJ298_10090 [Ruminococcus sp.]|nr:hypothetical protein [Ruminococcus sp.]